MAPPATPAAARAPGAPIVVFGPSAATITAPRMPSQTFSVTAGMPSTTPTVAMPVAALGVTGATPSVPRTSPPIVSVPAGTSTTTPTVAMRVAALGGTGTTPSEPRTSPPIVGVPAETPTATPTNATPVATLGVTGATLSVPRTSPHVVGVPAGTSTTTPTVAMRVAALGGTGATPSVPRPSPHVVGVPAGTSTTTPSVAMRVAALGRTGATPSAPRTSPPIAGVPAGTPTTTPAVATPVATLGVTAATPSVPRTSPPIVGVPAGTPTTTPSVSTPVATLGVPAATPSVPRTSPPIVGVPAGTPTTTPSVATPVATLGVTAATPSVPRTSPPIVGVPAGTPTTTPAVATPVATLGVTGATSPARRAPAASSGAPSPCGIVAASPAAMLEASSAAAAQARARAHTSAMAMALRRLSKYAMVVKGSKVSDKALEELASVVKFASQFEDAEPGLQLVVHLSGVTPGGELGWASIYGDGAYVDPDVLRVFAIAHQFCRGRDLLVTTGLAANCPPARLAGTLHRDGVPPTPLSAAPPSPSVADLEFMDATLEPQLDRVRPPSVGIQRLARQAARARSASTSWSASPPPDGGSRDVWVGSSPVNGRDAVAASGRTNSSGVECGGDEDGARVARLLSGFGADGLLPFVLETLRPPEPVTASFLAVDFMSRIFKRRAPITLLRTVLQAAILFFAMKFKKGVRVINEGFSRWWAHQLILDQSESGEVMDKDRWPLSVVVPVTFLPVKVAKKLPVAMTRTRNAALAAEGDTDKNDGDNDGGNFNAVPRAAQKAASEPAVLVELDGVPVDETHCKTEHAVAAVLLLWDKEPTVRSIVEAELFRFDRMASNRKVAPRRKAAAKTAAAAAGEGQALARAPTLAPRPPAVGGDVSGGGGGGGGGDPVRDGGCSGASAVLSARAAARAAAAAGAATPSPPRRTGGVITKRSLGAPAAARPSKRGRQAALPGSHGAGSSPPAVMDGPCDLLDAGGVPVATGVVDLGRRVLHTREVPPHLAVLEVTGVTNASVPYPFEADFPVEPPGAGHRLMGDTTAHFIVWPLCSLLSV